MASNPPAQCCTVGVKHDGQPQGKTIQVGQYDVYVAEPKGNNKHDGVALLYLPDVIGIWQNSQLMADQFAANGYYTIIPDLFNKDPLALNRPADFDFMKWLTQGSDGKNPHTKEAVDPIVELSLKYLKDQGFTKIGALGYCFGAKVRAPPPRFPSPSRPHKLTPVHSTLPATTRTASRSVSSPTLPLSTRRSSPPSPVPGPSPPPRPTRSSPPSCATSPRKSSRRRASPTRSTCSAAPSTASRSAATCPTRPRGSPRSRLSSRPSNGSTTTCCKGRNKMENVKVTPSLGRLRVVSRQIVHG